MLYNNSEYTVINNGNICDYFKLERGVRQGCPISAYIFILAIEVLANKIKFEKDMKVININNKTIKLSMLADDLTLIITNLGSLENAVKLLNIFSQCSGLKINIDTTKAKSIGTSESTEHYHHGLPWIKIPIETLGIHITNNLEESFNYNCKPKIATFKNLLQIWKQSTLTIKGKITIVNTLALSPTSMYLV